MEKSFFLFSCKCSDLNLPLDGAEQQKIGFKGILTLPKPIQFKSSVKDSFQVDQRLFSGVFFLKNMLM